MSPDPVPSLYSSRTFGYIQKIIRMNVSKVRDKRDRLSRKPFEPMITQILKTCLPQAGITQISSTTFLICGIKGGTFVTPYKREGAR